MLHRKPAGLVTCVATIEGEAVDTPLEIAINTFFMCGVFVLKTIINLQGITFEV